MRKALGFQGLIITDDLEMGAIDKKWGVPQGAAASFEAGADILLICKDQNKVRESIEILRKKLIRGEISSQRLQESVERIEKTKAKFLAHWEKVSLEKVKNLFFE
ncbi:MAG: hypothetical protein JJE15_13760 [Desulfobacteraceae bacterium]|nr:hypothetical protein [Desulfobacteraceae bacterium]